MGRDDIGKLAPGAKADFVLVDLKNPFMMPARDPLRSLIYTAADRAIRVGLAVDDQERPSREQSQHARAIELVEHAGDDLVPEGAARLLRDLLLLAIVGRHAVGDGNCVRAALPGVVVEAPKFASVGAWFAPGSRLNSVGVDQLRKSLSIR